MRDALLVLDWGTWQPPDKVLHLTKYLADICNTLSDKGGIVMLLLKRDMLTDNLYFIIRFNMLQYNALQWTMIYRESRMAK